jgi:RNA polymerase sigma factor (sigma-70 family)
MPTAATNRMIDSLRRLLARDGGAATDGELLGLFIERRDESAFAALVHRHGPMVMGVCRRVTGHTQDAEDAFQAAFVVLAHKARAIQPRDAVGNWLYGVAYHSALKARDGASRRRLKEKLVGTLPETPIPQDSPEDLVRLLDQCMSGLADKYRLPLVLCDLEGRSRREVARQLDILEGTLSSRLTTARKLLAKRLTRQGVVLSAAALSVALTDRALLASVSPALLTTTVKVATLVAAGPTAAAAGTALSANVAALSQGVMQTMFMTKLKSVAFVLLAVAGLGVGGSQFLFFAAGPKVEAQEKQEKKSDKADEPKRRTGTVIGQIVSTKPTVGNVNTILEVLAQGEEKPRTYRVMWDQKIKKPSPPILEAVRAANVGDRVQIEWTDGHEGLWITAFKVLKKNPHADEKKHVEEKKHAEEKHKEKDPHEGKKGVTIGTLVSIAKEGNAIEVRADGEEKARRYVPQWVKIPDKKFGGFDPKMLKTFSQLKVGSRIEVEWLFEERLRAMGVKVLKEAP